VPRHRSNRPVAKSKVLVELITFRMILAFTCAVVGSGGAAMTYIGTHDEPWWWLKGLTSAAVCVALAAVGLAIWRQWRR
jgi:hypothetical protein